MQRVLIVDDEPAIRESLAYALQRDGFQTIEAPTLREALALRAGVDLVILDLMLPDGSGLDFLKELRAGSTLPVIVLTSRDEEPDRIVGLEVGADDYVTKPFSPREIVARVRAVLRRSRPGAAPEETLCARGYRLGLATRIATVDGREIPLSKTEFDIFAVLLGSPSRVFERDHLLQRVWGDDCVVSDRTVDVHVKSLRRKIQEVGGDASPIETVRGVGYRFRIQDEG